MPEKFFNRKGYYSINVMAVCDHHKKIRYFTARHAGSAHDSRIFTESALVQKLEERFNPENPLVLLGDEGYACSQVLHFLLNPSSLTFMSHESLA